MAEPDFSVTTPDWLKGGRDAADEFLRMQAGNQRQQQLRMQQREQNALLPLKLREFEQTSQLNALRLQDEFQKRQDLIDAEKAAQELSRGPIAGLLREGKTEEALNAYLEAGIRNPNLRKTKAYGELSDDLRFTVQVKENARLREEMEKGRMERQKSLDAEREARTKSLESTPHMKEVDAYLQALDSGDIEKAELLKQGLLTRGVTPGELEKKVKFIRGMPELTPEQRELAIGVAVGTEGRAGVEHSAQEFVLRNLPKAIEAEALNPTGPFEGGADLGPLGKWGAKRRQKTTEELAEDILTMHRAATRTPGAPTPPRPPGGPTDKATILEDARAALKLGAPRDQVIERLKNLGITEEP